MATPAMGATMKGPMYTIRENGAQHGGHVFHLRFSTFKGSPLKHNKEEGAAAGCGKEGVQTALCALSEM